MFSNVSRTYMLLLLRSLPGITKPQLASFSSLPQFKLDLKLSRAVPETVVTSSSHFACCLWKLSLSTTAVCSIRCAKRP